LFLLTIIGVIVGAVGGRSDVVLEVAIAVGTELNPTIVVWTKIRRNLFTSLSCLSKSVSFFLNVGSFAI